MLFRSRVSHVLFRSGGINCYPFLRGGDRVPRVFPDSPRLGRFRRVRWAALLIVACLIGVGYLLPLISRTFYTYSLSFGLSCPFPAPFSLHIYNFTTIRTHMTEQRPQFSFSFFPFLLLPYLGDVSNVICWSVLGRYIP